MNLFNAFNKSGFAPIGLIDSELEATCFPDSSLQKYINYWFLYRLPDVLQIICSILVVPADPFGVGTSFELEFIFLGRMISLQELIEIYMSIRVPWVLTEILGN